MFCMFGSVKTDDFVTFIKKFNVDNVDNSYF